MLANNYLITNVFNLEVFPLYCYYVEWGLFKIDQVLYKKQVINNIILGDFNVFYYG